MTQEKATFTDLGLNENLLKAIHEIGYIHATPIQEQAIPYALMGRDVIGIAQTGTGKTASFTLPMLEILGNGKARARMPRALILAPTRELAAQILDNFKEYGKYTNITAVLVVGGDSMNEQTAQLQRGVDVVIATPGRLLDHFQRGGLILTDVKFFVIDEADRMLDMGFIPDIEKIASTLPKLRQTLMFTATMPPAIKKLSATFLQNPKEVTVARQSSTAQTITQNLYMTGERQKAFDLLALLQQIDPPSALIFCNRKTEVEKIRRFLHQHKLKVVAMHGDMMQSKRYESLEQFKSGVARIIVCSDVAARGIDIDDISYVFNYDLPRNPEDYVHRIGRTGRAGKQGHAISFVTPEDDKNLDALHKLIQQQIPVMPALAKAARPERAKRPERMERPEKSERPERTEKTERTPRVARPHADKPAPAPRPERTAASAPKQDQRPARSTSQDDDDDVKGFGSELPAFMK